MTDRTRRVSLITFLSAIAVFAPGITIIAFATPALAQSTPTPAVVKNIVTDFGAHCNGVDNDVQAFTDFHDWALTWQQTNSGLIELDIPSGAKCMFLSTAGVVVHYPGAYTGRYIDRG